MTLRLGLLIALWLALAGATPLPLEPPAPSLLGIVPVPSLDADKPGQTVSLPPLRAPRSTVSELPPAAIVLPAVPPPVPALPSSARGLFGCEATWLAGPRDPLACGSEAFQREEWEAAVRYFQEAAAGRRDDRWAAGAFWLGMSHLRLKPPRADRARPLLADVAARAGSYAQWARLHLGWLDLGEGNLVGARGHFDALGAAGARDGRSFTVWAAHGRALVLYELRQYADAYREWRGAVAGAHDTDIFSDLLFFYGEAAGRAGELTSAVEAFAHLRRGGDGRLRTEGRLREGAWLLKAGRAREGADALSDYLAGAPAGDRHRPWAEGARLDAWLRTGDARAQAQLEALARQRSGSTAPALFLRAEAALAAGRGKDARPALEQSLGLELEPEARHWALVALGDAHRLEQNLDEARSAYTQALERADGAACRSERPEAPSSPVGQAALLRLAWVNVELKEHAEAARQARCLASAGDKLPAELRGPVSHLAAESAYRAGEFAAAADRYRELRAARGSPNVADLGQAWATFRQGDAAEGHRLLAEFARAHPRDPAVPDALLGAADAALAAGSPERAVPVLEHFARAFPRDPRLPVARLAQAIAKLRAGASRDARSELDALLGAGTLPAALVPVARQARGATALGGEPGSLRQASADLEQALGGASPSAFARLGLGVIAFHEARLDAARQAFGDARLRGSPPIAASAEYGLAAVAYRQGTPAAAAEFAGPAAAALAAQPHGPMAPGLLYVLAGIGVERKRWDEALTHADRLAKDFRDDARADDGLYRVGSAAAEARRWPVARQALRRLHEQYPKSPFVALTYRQLGEAEAAEGQQGAAAHAYERAAATGSGDAAGALVVARDKLGRKEWEEARRRFDEVLRSPDDTQAAAAAYQIGETFAGEAGQMRAAAPPPGQAREVAEPRAGDAAARDRLDAATRELLTRAVDYYLSAGYIRPDSTDGRQGFLAAARLLHELGDVAAARALYQKLLGQPGLPARLHYDAREGLRRLPRSGSPR